MTLVGSLLSFSRAFDIVSEFIIQSALVNYRSAARLQKEKGLPECQPKAKMVVK
jgi:hypothetical protein